MTNKNPFQNNENSKLEREISLATYFKDYSYLFHPLIQPCQLTYWSEEGNITLFGKEMVQKK